MAFVRREKGGFSVRQGTPPFGVLERFESRADAERKKEQVERENNPQPSASGAAASRAFTTAKREGDVEVLEGVSVVRQPRRLVTQRPQAPRRGAAEMMNRDRNGADNEGGRNRRRNRRR